MYPHLPLSRALFCLSAHHPFSLQFKTSKERLWLTLLGLGAYLWINHFWPEVETERTWNFLYKSHSGNWWWWGEVGAEGWNGGGEIIQCWEMYFQPFWVKWSHENSGNVTETSKGHTLGIRIMFWRKGNSRLILKICKTKSQQDQGIC